MSGYVLKHPHGSFEDRAAKVAALADEISGTWTGAAAEAVGKLSMVAPSYDESPGSWPTLQSAELPWLDGGRLIESLESSSKSKFNAGMIIASLEHSMAIVFPRLEEVREALHVTRAVVTEALSRGPQPGRCALPPSFGISPDGHADTIEVVATIEALGDDLTLHPKSFYGEMGRDLEDEITRGIAEALSLHEARTGKLQSWNGSQMRGMAETTVRRILSAAGMPLEYALGRLQLSNCLDFEFDDGRQSARLEWCDGLLTADFEDDTAQVFLSSGHLEFPPLPNSLAYGLAGRRIGQVLTQAYIDPTIRILQANVDDRRTILKLDMTSEPLVPMGSAVD